MKEEIKENQGAATRNNFKRTKPTVDDHRRMILLTKRNESISECLLAPKLKCGDIKEK